MIEIDPKIQKEERMKEALSKKTLKASFCNFFDIERKSRMGFVNPSGEIAYVPESNLHMMNSFNKKKQVNVKSIGLYKERFYKMNSENLAVDYNKETIDEIFTLLKEPLNKDRIKILIDSDNPNLGPCLISVEKGFIILAPMEVE